MCGREVSELFPPPGPPRPPPGRPLLAVRDLSVATQAGGPLRLHNLSLEVHPGEVVGIGGLLGAGRTELLLHLYGAFGTARGGQVTLDGQPFTPGSPAQALAAGVALLSEERRRYGLCMDESVGFNLSLSSLAELSPHGIIQATAESRRNLDMAERVRLRSAAGAQTLAAAARTLSGGNQQKVVLGKALLTRPRLLLLDEPTRGIDIGAKQEIYELVRRLCQSGLGVLMASSELPELLGLCDRILVLHEGRLAGTFPRSQSSPELLLAAALGRPSPSGIEGSP
jgi:D-xylose transport system ATP-binding protein